MLTRRATGASGVSPTLVASIAQKAHFLQSRHRMIDSPRLGEQITRLIRRLAVEKGWSMTSTMRHVAEQTHYSPDMIYRWKQGKACPSPETLRTLARIGQEEANLDRAWGESLLKAARHPDSMTIENELWGPKEIRVIPCNLPTPEHTVLIGRQNEITDLLELL